MSVTIYTTPTCGYCHQAKQYLSQKGVKYTEVDISRYQAAAQEMMRLTGQMGVPVIVIEENRLLVLTGRELTSFWLMVVMGNAHHSD